MPLRQAPNLATASPLGMAGKLSAPVRSWQQSSAWFSVSSKPCKYIAQHCNADPCCCGQAPEVATDWPLGMPKKLSAPVRASPFSSAPLSPFGPASPPHQQRSGGNGGGGGAASDPKGTLPGTLREGEAGASAAIPMPDGGGDAGGKVLPGLGAISISHDMHVLGSASCPT